MQCDRGFDLGVKQQHGHSAGACPRGKQPRTSRLLCRLPLPLSTLCADPSSSSPLDSCGLEGLNAMGLAAAEPALPALPGCCSASFGEEPLRLEEDPYRLCMPRRCMHTLSRRARLCTNGKQWGH